MRPSAPSRRVVVLGGAAGLAALSACSSGSSSGGERTTPPRGGVDLVPLSDVPVGEAVSVDGPDGPLVVAQPAEGDVVAFSAVCTHQGCTVAPDGDRLRCPCHGSVFDAATGDNLEGPATRPLPRIAVEVRDGQVRTA